jgi:hypothetical protein
VIFDAEAEALQFLIDNGFDPWEPPHIETVAAAACGSRGIVIVPRLPVPARFRPLTNSIEIRPSLTRVQHGYCLAHELGERYAFRTGVPEEFVEEYSNRFGTAVLVPAPALKAALRALGRNLPALARAFHTSQTIITLRLGEVTRSPLALVTPRKVFVRGEEFCWPDERELRRVAVASVVPEELERRELTDAPKRVVLWAA